MTPENGYGYGLTERNAEWVAGFFADWLQRLVAAVPPKVVRPEAPGAGVSVFRTRAPGAVLRYKLGFPAWTLRQPGLTQDSHDRGSEGGSADSKNCARWPRSELAAAHAWLAACVALDVESTATRLYRASTPRGMDGERAASCGLGGSGACAHLLIGA